MTQYPFRSITIIYNPNSTGNSERDAKDLHAALRKRLTSVEVTLKPTEYAGHAEVIAKDIATGSKKALIVSASGDGGYNEVVNGVLEVSNADTVVCVLPSGNANDHYRAIEDGNLLERIIEPTIKKIDAIEVRGLVDTKDHVRFAHSYVGFGLTAYIGKKLTEASLNPFNEKWMVIKYMVLFQGVTLRLLPDKRMHKYSSVVFSNIDKMSKIIKLAPEADLEDGEVECYTMRSYSFWSMVFSLLFASTIGFTPVKRVKKQTILSTKRLEAQLDGEHYIYDAGHEVQIAVAKQRIKTL
jgi:diacylglycerol kinase family enzyme